MEITCNTSADTTVENVLDQARQHPRIREKLSTIHRLQNELSTQMMLLIGEIVKINSTEKCMIIRSIPSLKKKPNLAAGETTLNEEEQQATHRLRWETAEQTEMLQEEQEQLLLKNIQQLAGLIQAIQKAAASAHNEQQQAASQARAKLLLHFEHLAKLGLDHQDQFGLDDHEFENLLASSFSGEVEAFVTWKQPIQDEWERMRSRRRKYQKTLAAEAAQTEKKRFQKLLEVEAGLVCNLQGTLRIISETPRRRADTFPKLNQHLQQAIAELSDAAQREGIEVPETKDLVQQLIDAVREPITCICTAIEAVETEEEDDAPTNLPKKTIPRWMANPKLVATITLVSIIILFGADIIRKSGRQTQAEAPPPARATPPEVQKTVVVSSPQRNPSSQPAPRRPNRLSSPSMPFPPLVEEVQQGLQLQLNGEASSTPFSATANLEFRGHPIAAEMNLFAPSRQKITEWYPFLDTSRRPQVRLFHHSFVRDGGGTNNILNRYSDLSTLEDPQIRVFSIDSNMPNLNGRPPSPVEGWQEVWLRGKVYLLYHVDNAATFVNPPRLDAQGTLLILQPRTDGHLTEIARLQLDNRTQQYALRVPNGESILVGSVDIGTGYQPLFEKAVNCLFLFD